MLFFNRFKGFIFHVLAWGKNSKLPSKWGKKFLCIGELARCGQVIIGPLDGSSKLYLAVTTRLVGHRCPEAKGDQSFLSGCQPPAVWLLDPEPYFSSLRVMPDSVPGARGLFQKRFERLNIQPNRLPADNLSVLEDSHGCFFNRDRHRSAGLRS